MFTSNLIDIIQKMSVQRFLVGTRSNLVTTSINSSLRRHYLTDAKALPESVTSFLTREIWTFSDRCRILFFPWPPPTDAQAHMGVRTHVCINPNPHTHFPLNSCRFDTIHEIWMAYFNLNGFVSIVPSHDLAPISYLLAPILKSIVQPELRVLT